MARRKGGGRAKRQGKVDTKAVKAASLLGLPTEIREQIFKLASHSTNVLLHVEHISPRRMRFQPKLPPLYYVCRLTYNEFPLEEFYANTTFVLTDSMLDMRVLEAFIATRGEAVHKIASMKIDITRYLPTMRAFTGTVFGVRFSMQKRDDGVVVVERLTANSRDQDLRSGAGLCKCGLLEEADQGGQRGDSLMMILQSFLARFEPTSVSAAAADERAWRSRNCTNCRNVKFELVEVPVYEFEHRPVGNGAGDIQTDGTSSRVRFIQRHPGP
ncbi:hypothetical protein LTR56_020249 [Elasticomyces elasticus]|nr:hypothetical protein LTR56_020249 [Elasticomyces elasticus]KAK5747850.1 hypothetical protein LTS12_022107 [Elasticomyces elasticus]